MLQGLSLGKYLEGNPSSGENRYRESGQKAVSHPEICSDGCSCYPSKASNMVPNGRNTNQVATLHYKHYTPSQLLSASACRSDWRWLRCAVLYYGFLSRLFWRWIPPSLYHFTPGAKYNLLCSGHSTDHETSLKEVIVCNYVTPRAAQMTPRVIYSHQLYLQLFGIWFCIYSNGWEKVIDGNLMAQSVHRRCLASSRCFSSRWFTLCVNIIK